MTTNTICRLDSSDVYSIIGGPDWRCGPHRGELLQISALHGIIWVDPKRIPEELQQNLLGTTTHSGQFFTREEFVYQALPCENKPGCAMIPTIDFYLTFARFFKLAVHRASRF